MVYDKVIVPHLQRMINLEKLALYFVCDIHKTFIDGNNLKKNIISHMPHLNQLIFNIRSIVQLTDLMYFSSNEDIHRTFTTLKDYQVISCVDYFPKAGYGQCHIYSCPYSLTHYDNITNHFPGGLFSTVHEIELFDERPFEHEFFLRLAQSFPFMKELVLHNREAQKNDNQQWSIIEYLHIILLDLIQAHDNYVEQFLNNAKCCLINDIYLHVDYNTLQRVTENFTNDVTRMNCSKIKWLILYDKPELCPGLKDYFPQTEIC